MEKNEKNVRPIHELSQDLLEWLRSQSYGADSLNKHRQLANKIRKFMVANGISKYTTAVGDAFFENYCFKRDVCNHHKKRIKMIVYRLNDCIAGKMPGLRRITHVGGDPLTDQFAAIFEKYIGWCEIHGSKASTIREKSKHCGDFLRHLANLGCTTINNMTPEQIYSACLVFNNKNAWSHVRMLLRYLCENCYVSRDYSSLVPHYRRPFVMPSVYTEEEIIRMEAVIDRTSKTGIRDYAMVLLAARYGLRAGDIVKLSFQNLDFERCNIRLIQEKTGQLWEAEMFPDVKNALLHYINNVRIHTDSETVFLRRRAPFCGISISSLSDAVNRYFIMAGINPDGRKRGSHALRSSLASSMVNNNVPYEVVRKVLGHADPNAIKHYAKIDVERLREYAIPVPKPTGIFACFLNGEVTI